MSDQKQPAPEKPLAAARRRLDGTERAERKGVAIGLAAAGLPQTKIANALGLSKQQLSATLAPDQETIQQIRDRLKSVKIRHLERITGRLYPRIERDADKGDAKDIDALMRAAHAAEKIEAQISGEGQQVTVRGVQSEAPNIDLKLLIQNILGNEPPR